MVALRLWTSALRVWTREANSPCESVPCAIWDVLGDGWTLRLFDTLRLNDVEPDTDDDAATDDEGDGLDEKLRDEDGDLVTLLVASGLGTKSNESLQSPLQPRPDEMHKDSKGSDSTASQGKANGPADVEVVTQLSDIEVEMIRGVNEEEYTTLMLAASAATLSVKFVHSSLKVWPCP